jgi:hypothetical protein
VANGGLKICAIATALAACSTTGTGPTDGGGADSTSASSSGGSTSGSGGSSESESSLDSGPDSTVDNGANTDGGGDATVTDGESPGVDAADGSQEASTLAGDSSGDEMSGTLDAGRTVEGGLGGGCVAKLFDTLLVRTDEVLIDETATSNPQTISDWTRDNPDGSVGFALKVGGNVQQGAYHGCVAKPGTAYCWATDPNDGNTYGQLGFGGSAVGGMPTAYRATTPVQATLPLEWVAAVATGTDTNTACAITTRSQSVNMPGPGGFFCWGDLTWIANGGSTLVSATATAIGTPPGVIVAALGPQQACVVVGGIPNTVYCWGHNSHGELGQGDTTDRQNPTSVPGLTNPTDVVLSPSGSSGATVCALDGANVRCWGNNDSGATGTNTTTNPVLSPAVVVTQGGAPLDGVDDLRAGNTAFAVHRTDNTMWTWGWGSQGYASSYGIANVLAVGWAGPAAANGPRFVTSDGDYHNAASTVPVNCDPM